ncbi:MAG: response regulator transcription factor [Clostridium sp.]|nr:response regulator transcription factor [Clostridium sp.]MCM1399959.1 response regulator transcription factor [Clostridium sp.]MCM1460300.1 response regulator transcription factor [Bacteroides sp.]
MRVLLVDDDALVAISLKTILEATNKIDVIATGNSGMEAVSLYEAYQPDVLLMDIRMGEMSGLEAGEIILARHDDAKILYLTTFMDDEYIVKALNIGAKGYILKQDFEGIVPALEAVVKGQSVFGADIIGKIPDLIDKRNGFDYESYGISDKEYEIIAEVASGKSNKEIAATLYLSEGTVRNYISVILEKLELRDRTQLAVFYLTGQGNS